MDKKQLPIRILITLLLVTANCMAGTVSQDQIDDLKRLNTTDSETTPPKQESVTSNRTDEVIEFVIDDESKEELGKAVYANQLWTMRRNEKIYAWQDFSTKLIFVLVIILVFVGVIFSGMQFFKQHRSSTPSVDKDGVSHIEFSTGGIKVSSPFIGLILLIISLGFFYLYLVYVYPISLTK